MRGVISLAMVQAISFAAIIDRIAIVVDKSPILASAIDRDIRVTSFLNHERPDFSVASRKRAASRLIDQELIRTEIRSGDYPVAPQSEGTELLAQIRKARPDYRDALARLGITEDELKDRLLWQMTVLRFIDTRFRPGTTATDEQVVQYYNAHRRDFKETLDQARSKITEELTGQQVNSMLDQWLAQKRKETRIEYLENALQ